MIKTYFMLNSLIIIIAMGSIGCQTQKKFIAKGNWNGNKSFHELELNDTLKLYRADSKNLKFKNNGSFKKWQRRIAKDARMIVGCGKVTFFDKLFFGNTCEWKESGTWKIVGAKFLLLTHKHSSVIQKFEIIKKSDDYIEIILKESKNLK